MSGSHDGPSRRAHSAQLVGPSRRLRRPPTRERGPMPLVRLANDPSLRRARRRDRWRPTDPHPGPPPRPSAVRCRWREPRPSGRRRCRQADSGCRPGGPRRRRHWRGCRVPGRGGLAPREPCGPQPVASRPVFRRTGVGPRSSGGGRPAVNGGGRTSVPGVGSVRVGARARGNRQTILHPAALLGNPPSGSADTPEVPLVSPVGCSGSPAGRASAAPRRSPRRHTCLPRRVRRPS